MKKAEIEFVNTTALRKKHEGKILGIRLNKQEFIREEKGTTIVEVPILKRTQAGNLELKENILLLKEDKIVCVSESEDKNFLALLARNANEKTIELKIIRIIEDTFQDIIERQSEVDEAIDSIESYIIKGKTKKTMEKIFSIKKDLLNVRTATKQYLRLIGRISRKNKSLYEITLPVYEEILHFDETSESQKEMLSNMVDAHLSTVSNKMNQIMKVLTVIATIAMPLTVISSMFGMNVDLPNTSFWQVLGIMAVLVIIILLVFLKLGWLREKE